MSEDTDRDHHREIGWRQVVAAAFIAFLEDFDWIVWMAMLVVGLGVLGVCFKFMFWALS